MAALFPLSLAPGVLWVAALLSSLLALPRLFAVDHASGWLAAMALSPRPLAALLSGKMAAHWLSPGVAW